MIKRSSLFLSLFLLSALSRLGWAADEVAETVQKVAAEPGIDTGQIVTVLAGLAFVLLLVFGCGWFLKRFSGMNASRGGNIKVISVLPVGTRERLALVEVGDQQLLLGVTAQQINTLHTFDEPVADASETKNNSEFAQKLHQMMSRK